MFIPFAIAGSPVLISGGHVGSVEDASAATCKLVKAKIGLLDAISCGGTGAQNYSVEATVGVEWDDTTHPMCNQSPAPKKHENQFYIDFQKGQDTQNADGTVDPGDPIPNVLHFEVEGEAETSGSAVQFDATDPSWWWSFSASIVDRAVTAGEWDPQKNKFTPINVNVMPGHTEKPLNVSGLDPNTTNPPQNPGEGTESKPNPVTQAQKSGSRKGIVPDNIARTKIRLFYKTESTAVSATGDNVDVEKMRLQYEFEFSAGPPS